MALHAGLDASFGNMQDWKGAWQKQVKLIGKKAYGIIN
jgi:hypothetical protein